MCELKSNFNLLYMYAVVKKNTKKIQAGWTFDL